MHQFIATIILATLRRPKSPQKHTRPRRKNCILSRATNTGGSRGENGLTRQHDWRSCRASCEGDSWQYVVVCPWSFSPFTFKNGRLALSFAPGRDHSTRKPWSRLMTRVAARTHPNTPEYRSRPHVLTLNIPRSYPVAFEISKLLDCGLDKESLAILVSLCENGVSPEALATVVQELRREAKTLWNWLVLLVN